MNLQIHHYISELAHLPIGNFLVVRNIYGYLTYLPLKNPGKNINLA